MFYYPRFSYGEVKLGVRAGQLMLVVVYRRVVPGWVYRWGMVPGWVSRWVIPGPARAKDVPYQAEA